jgi:hypothetical protein
MFGSSFKEKDQMISTWAMSPKTLCQLEVETSHRILDNDNPRSDKIPRRFGHEKKWFQCQEEAQ